MNTIESMSVTRALLNEFRPFFRVLDDPFFSSPDPFALVPRTPHQNHHRHHRHSRNHQLEQQNSSGGLWSELGFGDIRSPRVELTEVDNKFVVSAEMLGVKKEDLDVSIGDGGRSLRIQGGSSFRSAAGEQEGTAETSEAPATEGTAQASATSKADFQRPFRPWNT